MVLYERHVSEKGKVSYVEHKTWVPSPDDEISNEELITLTASLGVTLLMVQQEMLPQHSTTRRKVKKVEDAILELFRGSGCKADPAMVDYFYQCWNGTTLKIAMKDKGQS